MVKFKGVLLVFLLFFAFFLMQSFVSAVPISSCTSINSAGTYTLSNDLKVYPQNVTSGRCIAISASNVVLDCQGKLIDDYTGLISGSLIYSTGLNTTIKNCKIYSYYVPGIVLSGASNSKVFNISFIGSYGGISLSNTLNSSIYNISSSDGSNIIRLNSGSNNNILYNLNLNSTRTDNLISLSNSHNNTFYNFNLIKTGGYSVYMYSSANNTFFKGIINSSYNYGLYLDSSQLNTFKEVNFKGNNTVFYSSISTDNYLSDSILDLRMKTTSSSSGFSSLYLINSSHNKSLENIGSGSTLYKGWYLDTFVKDNQNVPLSSANINITNNSNSLLYSINSDISGKNRAILYEYVNNGGFVSYYGNYSVNVSKNGYLPSSQSVNMSTNRELTFNLFGSVQTVYHPADTLVPDLNITSIEVKNYINNFYFNESIKLGNALYTLTLRQSGGKYYSTGEDNCDIYPWNCFVSI